MVYAPSRAEAVKAREVFARRYRPWYPKAVDVLEDDWERMVAFYDFPEDRSTHDERRPGSRSRARAGVHPGAPRSAPGASAAPAPSGSPSLARARNCPAPEIRHDSDADRGSCGESCYSAAHLGRLVREGKVPNAGRPGTPRIARGDLPQAGALAESRLAATLPLRRLILGPVTATWTPYGRHTKYPARLTLSSN